MHQISSMIDDIIMPILNLQLRVPTIHEKNVIETTVDANESNDKIIDFSRPSDYRMKAIELGVSFGDDASHVSGTSRISTVGTATSTESLRKIGNTPYEGKIKINEGSNTSFPSPLHLSHYKFFEDRKKG